MRTPPDAPRREAIAWRRLAHALGALPAYDAHDAPATRRLGRIALAPHQVDAVHRLAAILDDIGIALLADVTGLGKTYVACALASDRQPALVVAPAALRPQWTAAANATGVPLAFVSHERLSRGAFVPEVPPAFVIVDEAHHARNRHTTRWHTLAQLCRAAQVLLVTATPVHNRPADLSALFGLRLGEAIDDWPPSAYAPYTIRRRHSASVESMPRVLPWRWHTVTGNARVADRVLQLPPAMPAADGGEADTLWRWSLVRAWASSGAAFDAALRGRIARGVALEHALGTGRHLDRRALARWVTPDAVQPELFAEPSAMRDDLARWRQVVATHLAALRLLRRDAASMTAEDDAHRLAIVRRILGEDPDAIVLCFTGYQATAEWLWRSLGAIGGVALATGRGGRIASGPVDRARLLAELSAAARPMATRHARERVRALIATDVASEGLDLQQASVVVHLDLPWTAARIAQRTGRLVRLRSPHATVAVHALTPPAMADEHLGILRRLDDKARTAGALAADPLLPAEWRPTDDRGDADARESLRRLALVRAERGEHGVPARRADGRATDDEPPRPAAPVVVLPAAAEGVLAVLRHGGRWRVWPPPTAPLVAAIEHAVSARTAPVPRPMARRAESRARRRVARALAEERLRHVAGLEAAAPATLVRRLVQRVAREVARCPPHERGRGLAFAAAIRRRAAAPIAPGWQPELAALTTDTTRGGLAWLETAATWATAVGARDPQPPSADDELMALFVLVPGVPAA